MSVSGGWWRQGCRPDALPIAPWTIHLLRSGTFGLDGGAMLGSMPMIPWERTNLSTRNNIRSRVIFADKLIEEINYSEVKSFLGG